MKKIYIVAALIIVTFFNVTAQDDSDFDYYSSPNWMWTYDYSMAFTSGDMHDFIETPSFRGFNIQGRRFFLENAFSAGLSFGWNGFYQDFGRKMHEIDAAAITSNMYRYMYVTNVDANFHFYPLENDALIQPYVGFQIGTHFINKQLEVGSYIAKDESWRFSFAPEIGLLVPFGKDSEWGFHTSAKWNYSQFGRDNLDNITYIQVNTGFSYKY